MPLTDFDDRPVADALPGPASFENRTAPAAALGPQRETRAATRILVVDDESSTRLIMVEVLRRAGYQVEAVEDGLAGWDAVVTGSYHLLVTDNRMPRLTGVELIQRLRAAHIELPCLLASGAFPWGTPDLPCELQPGAALQKPFSAFELLSGVNAVLRANLVAGEARSLPVFA